MINYHVGITTYDRPQRIKRLLTQLRQQASVRTDTYVYHDGPAPPKGLEDRSDIELHTMNRHLGKEGYWRLFSRVWNDARKRLSMFDYFLFVQDDISIDDPGLLYEVGVEMEEMEEDIPGLVSFNLFGDGPRWAPVSRWTSRPVVQMINGFCFASWLDLQCVVFTPLAFEVITNVIKPRRPEGVESSGVGRQLSRRFDQAHCAQIMVPEPIVEHKDGGMSKMHPDRDMRDPYPEEPITHVPDEQETEES